METETTAWSEFPNEGQMATVEQIIVLEKINKSKSAGLWESYYDIWVGKLTIWVNYNKIHQIYQFHQNGR